MLSEKMLALGKKSSVIREIFEYSKKRKAEIGADKVFDFSLGNPSIPAPRCVDDAIKNLLSTCDSVDLHGYTSAAGDMETKKTIANNIKERFGLDADPALIYMTCGAAASLTITLKAIVEKGDEVILLAPYFPEYKVFAENAGAKVKTVLCKGEQFSLDLEALKKVINKNTRAIIINSPNNPSGAVLCESDIKALSQLLNEKRKETGRAVTIIADEPYRELAYDGVFVPYIPNYYDNTIVCYSYSKSLSIPGERIGYILVSPKTENAGDTFAAICGAGRSMGYVCAPSLLQRVVKECDGEKPDLTAYDKNRKLLYKSLTEMGYSAVYPEGAFYMFVKSPEPDAAAFCERAKKYELLLVPSDSFGVEGYVRIAYCVSYEQIKASIPAFKKLIDEYKEN
ncbi:MAG: pyridoxal phosphate-dependent aminotransferase [Oscillospiraceae bacterium]|nr:pyridoxal phosphate-dependent aminotransferase [Oscillospiraceae bacterium]